MVLATHSKVFPILASSVKLSLLPGKSRCPEQLHTLALLLLCPCMGGLGLGGSRDCGNQILCSLPGQATQRGSPQFCTHLIVGTQPRRPTAGSCNLPGDREERLIYPKETSSGFPAPLGQEQQPFWHCWSYGGWKLLGGSAILNAWGNVTQEVHHVLRPCKPLKNVPRTLTSVLRIQNLSRVFSFISIFIPHSQGLFRAWQAS